MKPKNIIVLILVVLSLVILIQNTHVVIFRVLFWKIAVSQIILIFLTMLIGFVIGFIVSKMTRKL
jgi:uncharacterized integral membrane protein